MQRSAGTVFGLFTATAEPALAQEEAMTTIRLVFASDNSRSTGRNGMSRKGEAPGAGCVAVPRASSSHGGCQEL